MARASQSVTLAPLFPFAAAFTESAVFPPDCRH
jgi:hypothetical protein